MAITRSTTKSATGIEFVDLSDKPAKAKIVRQGFDVPEAKLDTKKVDQFLGDLTQISTKEAPRVVSQAIAPGTKVTAGTVVDLVMAARTKIPFEIFDQVHADLATKTLDWIDPVFADLAAKKTLLTYATPEEVPTAEKAALTTALGKVGIAVDENNPNKTFAKAFNSVRGGFAFQG